MLAFFEALYRLLSTVNLRRFLFDRDYRRAAIDDDPERALLAVVGQVLAWSIIVGFVGIASIWLWNELGSY